MAAEKALGFIPVIVRRPRDDIICCDAVENDVVYWDRIIDKPFNLSLYPSCLWSHRCEESDLYSTSDH